jgi:DNA-3-methyladenine glycosylase I
MNWNTRPPKNDDGYLEQMSRAIFQAGLNWRVIENKWPNFKKAFSNFSAEKVARLGEREVKTLMQDAGIVRNERKIRATILNAKEFTRLKKEFGSFDNYLKSFKGDNDKVIADVQSRFRHLGESSSRTFLYMVGVKLKPTREEMSWHKKHT